MTDAFIKAGMYRWLVPPIDDRPSRREQLLAWVGVGLVVALLVLLALGEALIATVLVH